MSEKKALFTMILNPEVVLRMHDACAVKMTPGAGSSPEEQLNSTKVDWTASGPEATHAVVPIELYRALLLAMVTYVGYAKGVLDNYPQDSQDTLQVAFVEQASEVFDLMNDWFMQSVNHMIELTQKGGLN